MAIRHMSAVWERSTHKGSELLFMLAVADMANAVGLAWPGYVHLAHKTRMARRSVMRLASTCSQSGELWVLNRKLQRSNIYIVTIDLSIDELRQAAMQASEMGAVPTTGSDNLSPPPQVLEVVTSCHQVVTSCHQVVIPRPPRGDTAMSPDPSLSPIILSGEKEDPFSGLWSPVLETLKLQMTPETFQRWLDGSRIIEASNGTWTVQVSSAYAVDWLNNRMSTAIMRAMEQHAPETTVVFVAKGENA